MLCLAHNRCLVNDNVSQNLFYEATITLILKPKISHTKKKVTHQYHWGTQQFSSVQSLSHVQLLATPRTAACQPCLSITISQSLIKLASIQPSHGNAIQQSHPLLSPSTPTFSSSSIRVFSNESVFPIRWPKYWSFSFNISPSNEYSGLISFRMDWLDLCAVQGTFKSLLQHHSSKASVLQCSAFFIVQHSHPYMTAGKPWFWLDGPALAK